MNDSGIRPSHVAFVLVLTIAATALAVAFVPAAAIAANLLNGAM